MVGGDLDLTVTSKGLIFFGISNVANWMGAYLQGEFLRLNSQFQMGL